MQLRSALAMISELRLLCCRSLARTEYIAIPQPTGQFTLVRIFQFPTRFFYASTVLAAEIKVNTPSWVPVSNRGSLKALPMFSISQTSLETGCTPWLQYFAEGDIHFVVASRYQHGIGINCQPPLWCLPCWECMVHTPAYALYQGRVRADRSLIPP